MDQLKWHHDPRGEEYAVSFFKEMFGDDGNVEDEARQMANNVMVTLARADTIYVTSEMQHVLMQAAHDLPEDVTVDLHQLLCPIGFCMFEEGMHGQDRRGRNTSVHAIAWHVAPVNYTRLTPEQKAMYTEENERCVVVYFFTDTADVLDDFNTDYRQLLRDRGIPIPPVSLLHFYPLFDGGKMPDSDVQGSEIVNNIMKLFWAMQLLAQQKIGEPMKIDPDRATRKRFMRDWPDAPPPSITLITLRRKSVKKDDAEAASIPWTRRWVVRGHWRKQYYPKTKTHAWKYIYEYIKGPEDKPLIITERRVFNFRR